MTVRTKSIDCAGVQDEGAFWAAYMRDVRPAHSGFGRNLDAFRDALWGGPGWPEADELRFVHSASLRSLRGGAFIEELQQIASESGTTVLVFE